MAAVTETNKFLGLSFLSYAITFFLQLPGCVSSLNGGQLVVIGRQHVSQDSIEATSLSVVMVMCASGMVFSVAMAAMCVCCRQTKTTSTSNHNASNGPHYIGQIDLADIQVIYNPSAMTSHNVNRVLESSVAEEQSVAQPRLKDDRPAMSRDNASRLNNVVVENGRIVLQYQDVNTSTAPPPKKLDDVTVTSSSVPKHKLAPVGGRTKQLPRDKEYNMDDIVWKNVHAK